MSDPAQIPEASAQRTFSKDYWDQVFDQLGRRKLFRIATVILALFYAVAIYAPLLANDRPYVLQAVDYKDYAQAQRTLYPVTLSIARLIRQGPEEYEASTGEDVSIDWERALQIEVEAATGRVATMAASLPAGSTTKLDEFLERAAATVDAALAGETETATELAAELKALAKEIRTEFAAADPNDPESTGVALAPITSYPLIETITNTEIFFMVLWAFVLAWPLWNRVVNRVLLRGDRDRIRAVRKRKLAVVLGTSLAAAILWSFTVDGSMTFDFAPYKAELARKDIVAERVIFPPVAYGFAEMHNGEEHRPPTWTASSRISDDGYYEAGPRRPDFDADYVPPPTEVEIRWAEPERNAVLRHPLGTDSVGRDMVVRLIWGSRVSLSVGVISAALLVLIGVIIGACAGYFGGWVDLVLSRLIEIVLCFPAFFLILMVVAFTDPNVVPPILAIIVVIALVRWTGVARLTRAEFLKLREQEFALAAKATGVPALRTIFRHILPNAIGPILVAGAFSVAAGILTESALSFLGFGVKPPVASWGSLVNDSRSAEHWWIQTFPGFVIFVTVVCYNLVGEAIRDAVDPKMQVQ